MRKYFFSTEKSGNFAEHDQVGGAICIYLPEFTDVIGGTYEYGSIRDRLIQSIMIAVLVHEDIHEEISKNVDTLGEQEHSTVYQWIQDHLNKDP